MLSCGLHVADQAERAGLALVAGAKVLRIHRVRLVAGVPVMHDRLVLDATRVPDFSTEIENVPDLLYLFLVERYGIRISAVRERLTAELATEEDVQLLGVDPGGALLVINEVAHDQSGFPTILAVHRATTSSYCYVNEVR
jgi:GntR family transcriptional regulator